MCKPGAPILILPFNTAAKTERDILHIQPLLSMLIRVRATHCGMQYSFLSLVTSLKPHDNGSVLKANVRLMEFKMADSKPEL